VTPVTSESPSGRALWDGWAPFSLSVLGLAVALFGIRNQFVQDDLPLIARNQVVQTLAAPGRFFTEPYWHDPFPPALYRPLATTMHALQWAIGGGSAIPFRAVSALMVVAAGLVFFYLACRLLPRPGAWAAAALFMVHPVHVEAIGPAVNQGELMVALLLGLAMIIYLRPRHENRLSTRDGLAIVLLYLAASGFKEHALVLPILLLAAELTVVRGGVPLRAKISALRPFYLTLMLVAVGIVAVRTVVVGSAVGTPTAEALRDVGLGGRLLTMLAVVPHWARLLVWPAKLQADYGPSEIVAASGWGGAQTVGALILVSIAGLLAWSRTRMPVLAFAIVWVGIALAPVSNILVPTGLVLAERTLFLASMGACLAAGALIGTGWKHAGIRRVSVAVVAVLLVLGFVRSVSRTRAWRSQGTLLRHTVVDAPRSYTAHLAMTRFLEDSGSAAEAASHYRQAVGLMPRVQDLERFRAEQYRLAGYCGPALRHYRRALSIAPDDSLLRQGFASCLRGQEQRTPAGTAPQAASRPQLDP
jgi:protein O-mannosyl-transferase